MENHLNKIAEYVEFGMHDINSLEYLHNNYEAIADTTDEEGYLYSAIDALVFKLKHAFSEIEKHIDAIRAMPEIGR
jgi:hypothetical protein